MKIILLTALMLVGAGVYAQNKLGKKLVDNETERDWYPQEINNYGISDDGKFVFYCLNSGEVKVKSVRDSSVKTFSKVYGPSCFSTSDGELGYKSSIGNFFILTAFTKGKADTTADVESYQFFLKDGEKQLLYRSKGALLIRNLSTGEKQIISESADRYWINGPKSAIVYTSSEGLFWRNVGSKESKKIGSANEIEDASFDISGTKFLYSSAPGKELDNCVIGCYNASNNTSTLIDKHAEDIDSGFNIVKGSVKFNSDGNYIVFTLVKNITLDPYSAKARSRMDIWTSSQDRYISDVDHLPVVSYAIKDIGKKGSQIIRLEEGHDELIGIPGKDLMIINRHFVSPREQYQNIGSEKKIRVILLKGGSTLNMIPDNHRLLGNVMLSPNEKFLYWYNAADDGIYTYEIKTKVLKNVTAQIAVPKDLKYQSDGSVSRKLLNPSGIMKKQWLVDDDAFLIRDKFDLWQVDPTSRTPPINLTQGVGRNNQIIFDILPFANDKDLNKENIVLLRYQDQQNMENGFASVRMSEDKSLKTLHHDSCLYSWGYAYPLTPVVIKAKNENVWIMCSQTANKSLNLVVTRDFKGFTEISDVHPEREYNWLTSELIRYPIQGNVEGKGILYKPENFNAQKKYPVIFYYYQQISNELHVFRRPKLSNGGLSIPWYVSNGYLVFCPDIINDKPGNIAETTLNSVNAALNYLSRYSWVDTTKIGLQGHSFGGYETNLLITGSQRFAAAQASAGIADLIRGTTDISHELPGFAHYEYGQFNLYYNLWENPDVYLKNSPIFKANRVMTPLLLMHNRRDSSVPFGQSEGLFYALRRLKKPVWIIQYNNGMHTLVDKEDKLDFTIRQQQFFDHFLKGKPKPKWMVDGSLSLEVK
ncbi:alpha/beta hydrolase family protein [Pedobacter deserti]|uniref:alpha/beta hydrolase family protein n=1 Tax=Pedobacter deserti TaxID=2817382 RepID=UPI00210E2E00|nr:prolyl oligopeptidase family serine peptidase [Pedobacter sp. SYSU D00382]